MGDAHFLSGDVRTARLWYREAFALGPEQVDVKRLLDRELAAKLHEMREDDQWGGDSLAWFPVLARLDGTFEKRTFRDMDDLRRWLDRYMELVREHEKGVGCLIAPRLFFHAMALSDNARMVDGLSGVELAGIRQRMKECHPELFARYMEALEEKE